MKMLTKRKRVDENLTLGIVILSIPAKPLAQAKLKCGGFFIASIAVGEAEVKHQTGAVFRAAGGPTRDPWFLGRPHPSV
ncbi:MAG: hypothetical protein ACLQVY_05000 [Limisphaerales bacterium]